jgi:hypothetical protein
MAQNHDLENRITNIETAAEGIIYDVLTDNTSAHKKVVPSNTLPYAMIDRIGGIAKSKRIGTGLHTFSYYWNID